MRDELCNNKKHKIQKRENLKGMFRHNERRNRNYSNNNIDKEKIIFKLFIKRATI